MEDDVQYSIAEPNLKPLGAAASIISPLESLKIKSRRPHHSDEISANDAALLARLPPTSNTTGDKVSPPKSDNSQQSLTQNQWKMTWKVNSRGSAALTDNEGIIRRVEAQRAREKSSSLSPPPPLAADAASDGYGYTSRTLDSRTDSGCDAEEYQYVRSVSPGSARYQSFQDWDRIMNLETGSPHHANIPNTPSVRDWKLVPVPKLNFRKVSKQQLAGGSISSRYGPHHSLFENKKNKITSMGERPSRADKVDTRQSASAGPVASRTLSKIEEGLSPEMADHILERL